MAKRDSYVDVAKGICILLVVCIHTEVFGVIGMPLTFIAVPMFFFLSGFYDRSERAISNWLPKAIKTLILPGIIWLAIGLVFLNVFSYVKDRTIVFNNTIYEPFYGNGPVWFLFALVYAKLFTWIILRLSNNKLLAVLIAFVGGFFGLNYQMPLCLDEGLAAWPLYYIGKISYPYIEQLQKNICLNIVGVICFVLFLMHIFSFTIVPTGNALYKPFYPISLFAIIIVFIPVLRFCKVLIRGGKWLADVGKHSLGIMLVHVLMCHTVAVILNRVFEKGSLIWVGIFLIAYLLICIASYYLAIIIEKYMPLLFGKKAFK